VVPAESGRASPGWRPLRRILSWFPSGRRCSTLLRATNCCLSPGTWLRVVRGNAPGRTRTGSEALSVAAELFKIDGADVRAARQPFVLAPTVGLTVTGYEPHGEAAAETRTLAQEIAQCLRATAAVRKLHLPTSAARNPHCEAERNLLGREVPEDAVATIELPGSYPATATQLASTSRLIPKPCSRARSPVVVPLRCLVSPRAQTKSGLQSARAAGDHRRGYTPGAHGTSGYPADWQGQ
jgi:hypothetical protein